MDAPTDRQTDFNALSLNGFRLSTLGALSLMDSNGVSDASLSKRRRKLAVLVVLALSRRPVSRERLSEMFWGDEDETRARHSLSDALWNLRRVLGSDSIAMRQNEVSLSPTCSLTVDALELIAAVERRDHERVTELYVGPFLDCVNVANSASYTRWVTPLRDQMHRLWLTACGQRCLALARMRKWEECASLARRWLDSELLSTDAALYLLNALKAPGTIEAYRAALDEYDVLARRLERELQQSPGHDVAWLAASIRDQVVSLESQRSIKSERDAVASRAVIAPVDATIGSRVAEVDDRGVARPDAKSRKFVPSRLISTAVALVLFIAATSFTAQRAASRPARLVDDTRPAIALLDVRTNSSDTASAWLERGLPQMITSNIAGLPDIEVITPDRVREAREEMDIERGDALGRRVLVRLAHRLGADVVVTGSVMRGESLYVLDAAVHDLRNNAPPGLFTSANQSLTALVDQAAARLAGIANAGGSLSVFADGETSSIEAYQHYVRARRANDEDRYPDAVRDLDAAIALDSSFVSAIADRIPAAHRSGDRALERRLTKRLTLALERAALVDRLLASVATVARNGEHERAELLARDLVARYSRDARAYAQLAEQYVNHGKWNAADSVLTSELALDSLGVVAGSGACAQCIAYRSLAGLRAMRGDMAAAVTAAKRWVELQPDVPDAWSTYMSVLSFDGQFDAALAAHRRAVSLTPSANYSIDVARILIMARRYAEADALIASMLRIASRANSRDAIVDALDARALLERERGQFRRSAQTLGSAMALDSGIAMLRLVQANSLARAGEYAEAEALLTPVATPVHSRTTGGGSDDARAFAWHHALLADAIAPNADTLRLHAIADSIESVGARSYYARDWRLSHHVRGLIALRAGEYLRAENEFSASRWGIAGWTVSVVHQAQAQLELGRPDDALRTLRHAYAGPLVAMGRYQPRSEIDYWMSIVFTRVGQADSARLYAGYVRRAWEKADPEILKRLDVLEK
jgi:DNA-binding SARP family transcriptional activator/TolB-like protein